MKDISNIYNLYETKEGVPFYLLSKSVSFPEDSDDIYEYCYVSEDTPWTVVSWKLYDTIDYWWVVSSINKKSHFYAKRGEIIKFIPKKTLEDILNQI